MGPESDEQCLTISSLLTESSSKHLFKKSQNDKPSSLVVRNKGRDGIVVQYKYFLFPHGSKSKN